MNDINKNETIEALEEAPAESPAEAEELCATEEENAVNNDDEAPADITPEAVRSLREELASLKKELSDTRSAYERLSADCEEFSELFPTIPVTSLPDSIWKSFKSGIPLAAAYALYEKKEALAREKASNVNAKNKELSSGSLYSDKNGEYFTPDEVRAMSAAEVKANYTKIINSMSRWH